MSETQYISIAMDSHTWGRGTSIIDSIEKNPDFGDSFKKWKIFHLPEGATDGYASELGAICWTWTEGADTSGREVEISKDDLATASIELLYMSMSQAGGAALRAASLCENDKVKKWLERLAENLEHMNMSLDEGLSTD